MPEAREQNVTQTAGKDEGKKTAAKKAMDGARDSSESIGISIAGLAAWYVTEQDVPMPPELIAVLSGALGAIAGRLRQRLGEWRS